MAIDNDTVAAQTDTPQKPLKPAEEYISPGDANDLTMEAASDASASDSELNSDEDIFHPHRITLSTFRRLLSCYPTTVEQVHRRKAMLKLQPKPEKGSKRKGDKKAGSAMVLQKTDFNASEQNYIKEETDKYLALDKWRYEDMPKIMGERREKDKGEVMSKDDLISVMDWKLKHGVPRPTLMGMVKSNLNQNVIKCSSTAMAALSTEDPILAPNEAFPKPSIDAFGPLRGVGVATASLILSIATATGDPKQQVPFYSDDVYLWLCLNDFPEPEEYAEYEEGDTADQERLPDADADADAEAEDNEKPPRPPKFKLKRRISKFKLPKGEFNVRYNIAEYRKLWDACWELCERLNRAVNAESKSESTSTSTSTSVHISHNDIEKAAYVLRNIDVSGFLEGQISEENSRTAARQKARVDASGETAASEKKLAMKKARKEAEAEEEEEEEEEEERATQKKRKIATRGRNVQRRKVE